MGTIHRYGWQLFPSFIIATSTIRLDKFAQTKNPYYLGDPTGHIGIDVINPSDDTTIRLEVRISDIAEPSGFEGLLKEGGKHYKVFPNIAYRYATLLALKQPIPVSATFTLYVNDLLAGTQTKTIAVRSINDCVYQMVDNNNRVARVPWMLTAYVNENHPWIDGLLREALNTGVVTRFIGYQGTSDDVYRQVFAIWNVFQRRGFRYSSITTPTGESGGRVSSQYVRFFEDSIQTSQANCVDGSVMFASVLRRIGIDPVLVIVPRHCFLGFYVDRAQTDFRCIETTAMGNTNLSQYSEENTISGALAHLFGRETRNQASWRTFISALNIGADEFNRYHDTFNNPALGCYLLEIGASRKLGISPINH